MIVAHALREDRSTALQGTPLNHADLHVASTPHVHHVARRLVNVDRARSGQCRAVVIDDIEVRKTFDLENRSQRVERPVGGGRTDTVIVFQLRADCIAGAVFQVVRLRAGIGRGADNAVSFTERVNRHVVTVAGFRVRSGYQSGGRSRGIDVRFAVARITGGVSFDDLHGRIRGAIGKKERRDEGLTE